MAWHPELDHDQCDHDRSDEIDGSACELASALDDLQALLTDAASSIRAQVVDRSKRLAIDARGGLSGALKNADLAAGDVVIILPAPEAEWTLKVLLNAWKRLNEREATHTT